MSATKNVWVIQPYVPRYRVPLFERLIARLDTQGIEVRIAAGTASDAKQADRGDEVRPGWLERITWSQVGPVRISHARKLFQGADGVIFPHEGSNIELTAALVSRLMGGRTRVGLWGHIRNYVSDPNMVDVTIERWQLRHADGVFAYTQSGANFAANAGVRPERIVSLSNTIDTSQLRHEMRSLKNDELRRFQAKYQLVPRRTIAYLGGLDESKRIDILAELLDRLWEVQSDVKLVVGGNGRFASYLERAEARGQVVRLGYADNKLKALVAATAQFIVSPGRVGLLAVDALVMGLPIVTTQWRYHAPEIEYLTEGSTLFTSAVDAVSFTQLVLALLDKAPKQALDSMQLTFPLLDDLVDRFAAGIVNMLHRAD